jgi:hypothetical protein
MRFALRLPMGKATPTNVINTWIQDDRFVAMQNEGFQTISPPAAAIICWLYVHIEIRLQCNRSCDLFKNLLGQHLL